MTIQQEIINLRNRYVRTGKAPNFYEINNGFCEEFAMELLETMGGYSDKCFELCGENFMMGEDGDEYENDI